jgi:hypothetical protein
MGSFGGYDSAAWSVNGGWMAWGSSAAGSWQISVLVIDSIPYGGAFPHGQGSLYTNGMLSGSGFIDVTFMLQVGMPGFVNSSYTGARNTLNCFVAEVMVFSRALTEPERQSVEAYASQKYALSLTASHPLASVAPAASQSASRTPSPAVSSGASASATDAPHPADPLAKAVAGGPAGLSAVLSTVLSSIALNGGTGCITSSEITGPANSFVNVNYYRSGVSVIGYPTALPAVGRSSPMYPIKLSPLLTLWMYVAGTRSPTKLHVSVCEHSQLCELRLHNLL